MTDCAFLGCGEGVRLLDGFLIRHALLLITQTPSATATSTHERFDAYQLGRGVLHRERRLRPFLRKTVGPTMETVIVGLVALLLFVYLFVAMVRPEKF